MSMIRRAVSAGTLMVLSVVLGITVPGRAFAQADRYLPLAAMNAKLDSLEHLALTSDNPDQRRSAVSAISGAGWLRSALDAPPPPPPYSGIVARLARIYRQSDDYWVRWSINSLMVPQAERAEAVAFLEQVAQEPLVQPAPGDTVSVDAPTPLTSGALGALTLMEAEGRAALQRLYAQGTVRQPMARAYLEQLARQGFRKPGGS